MEPKSYSPGVMRYVEEAKRLIGRARSADGPDQNLEIRHDRRPRPLFARGVLLPQPGRPHRAALSLHLAILPGRRRARGGPRLPHPDLVLYADRQSDDLLSRMGPRPARRLQDRLGHVLLRHRLRAWRPSSMAVDPFLVKQKDGEKINFVSCDPGLRRHVPALQPAQGPGARDRGPLGPPSRGHRANGRPRSTRTRASSTWKRRRIRSSPSAT